MKTTTNKSLRPEPAIKALRREPVRTGETDDAHRAEGASGQPRRGRKRPGRAASLQGSPAVMRSQRWRNPAKGKRVKRRGVLAKGSRTGRR